jgi:hypothetical protein
MKRAQREAALVRAFDLLDAAAEAAESTGDPVSEERLIVQARLEAESDHRIARRFRNKLAQMTAEGLIRKSPYIGHVSNIFLWEDRIWIQPTDIYVLDEHIRASAETAGAIQVSTHPSLKTMLFGSVFAGTRLVNCDPDQDEQTRERSCGRTFSSQLRVAN